MSIAPSSRPKLRPLDLELPSRAPRLRGGARVWYFPDGYLPPKRAGDAVEAHEALMILNVSDTAAELQLDFYFEDKEPVLGVRVPLGARRVKCIRLDRPGDLGGVELPVATQYAIRLRSNVNVIVQQGRIDTTQSNLSYYGSMGMCERENRRA